MIEHFSQVPEVRLNRLFLFLVCGILAGSAVGGPTNVRAQTADDALIFSRRLPGIGLRSSGMGGAGVGGVGSGGALFTNPAGLGYVDEGGITAGLTTLVAREDARFRVGNLAPQSGSARSSHTAPSLVHALYDAPTTRGSLVIAGGYHATQDYTRVLRYDGSNPLSSITQNFLPFQDEYSVERMTDEEGPYYEITWNDAIPQLAYEGWAINFDGPAYENGEYPFYPTVAGGDVSLRQRDEVVEEGRKSEIALGGAVEAVEGGMAGMSVNIVTGTYRFDRVFEEIDRQNQVTGDAAPANFDALTFTETLTTEIVGINARGGFTTELGLGVRAGLLVETPTAYSLTDDYRTVVETVFDDGRTESAGRGRNAPGSGTFDYSLRTPWRFGAGLVYEIAGLHVAADLEYLDWSQMRFRAEDEQNYFSEVNRTIRTQFDPVWPRRLGVEYSLGSVGLRAGFAVQPDPRTGVDGPDRSRRYWTGGLTYRLGSRVRFEVSYVREQFEDQFRTYANAPVNPTVSEDVVRTHVTGGLRVGL